MSNNRSFVDFGRNREAEEAAGFSCAHPATRGLGIDLAREADRMIVDAFSRPPEPAPNVEPLTLEMLRELSETLRREYQPRLRVVASDHVPDGMAYMLDSRFVYDFGFRLDRIQPTFESAFGGLITVEPDEIAAEAVESHAPVAVERPKDRKQSYKDWLKESTELIEEHRRDHE